VYVLLTNTFSRTVLSKGIRRQRMEFRTQEKNYKFIVFFLPFFLITIKKTNQKIIVSLKENVYHWDSSILLPISIWFDFIIIDFFDFLFAFFFSSKTFWISSLLFVPLYTFLIIYFIYFLFEIGQSTDPNDEQILMDWYNSLQSKGTLNWDGINDLCQQTANQIYCDSSTQRVTLMYFLFFSFLFFFFCFIFILFFSSYYYFSLFFSLFILITTWLQTWKYRYLSGYGFQGTISKEFGNLTQLQVL